MEGSNHGSLRTRAGPLRTARRVISLQEQEGLTPAEIHNLAFDREQGAVPIDVVSDTSSSSSGIGAGLRENPTGELPVDPVADYYLRLHATTCVAEAITGQRVRNSPRQTERAPSELAQDAAAHSPRLAKKNGFSSRDAAREADLQDLHTPSVPEHLELSHNDAIATAGLNDNRGAVTESFPEERRYGRSSSAQAMEMQHVVPVQEALPATRAWWQLPMQEWPQHYTYQYPAHPDT